jgi:hypothetical protein
MEGAQPDAPAPQPRVRRCRPALDPQPHSAGPLVAERLRCRPCPLSPARWALPLPPQDGLARLLSTVYARIQSKAGRTAGVEPGEAWRAAMEVGGRGSGAAGKGQGAGVAVEDGLVVVAVQGSAGRGVWVL